MKTRILLLCIFAVTLLLTTCFKNDNGEDPVYPDSSIKDIDGNTYRVLKIGDQGWMLSNLKTTRLNDGTPLEYLYSGADWKQSKPGYCIYEHDSSNGAVYGALYNWYATESGKLCPLGWHVPTAYDWFTLILHTGGYTIGGGHLKDTVEWMPPNTGATNKFGFSALPAGSRSGVTGNFEQIGFYCGFWVQEEYNAASGYLEMISYDDAKISPETVRIKVEGVSVRCTKD